MIWSVNSLHYVTEPVERESQEWTYPSYIIFMKLPVTERFLCAGVFFRCAYAPNQRHKPLDLHIDTTAPSLLNFLSANWL